MEAYVSVTLQNTPVSMTHIKYNSNATVMIDKIITLFNEGYTGHKSTYTLNKIEHIYQSNLQCGLLT